MSSSDARSDDCPELDVPRTVGQPGMSAAAKYQQLVKRNPSLLFAQWSSAEAWLVGAEGEMIVAGALEELPSGWYITHDIVLPRNRGNLDHVVVGPPGVFVINTKNHGEQPTIVHGDVYTERHPGGHVAQGEREADLVTAALSGARGWRTTSVSVIAVLASDVMWVQQTSSRTTRIVLVPQLVQFLTNWPAQLGPCDAKRLTLVVRDPTTWG